MAMVEKMVPTMSNSQTLLDWLNHSLERVDTNHSPNIHVDEIEELSQKSGTHRSLTLDDLIDAYSGLLAKAKVDHQIYKLSLVIQLSDSKRPSSIRSLESVRKLSLQRMYTPPFFQLSARDLDKWTELDEVKRTPISVLQLGERRSKVLVFFEARIRSIDLEDGDCSFTRRVVFEPIVEFR
jgi:hypothetical protein